MAPRRLRSLLLLRSWQNASGALGARAVCPRGVVRRFAADAAPNAQDDIVKNVFINQQKKFRAILGEMARVKINVDPKDDKAVREYLSTMKQIRQKVGIPSYTEKLGDLLDSAAEDSPDVRTFFQIQRALRIEMSVPEVPEYDSGVSEAIAKVEKKIGKPLTRDDVKGLALFQGEIDALNAKLGLNPDSLEELEAELEVEIARTELTHMKKESESQIETFRRRDELDNIKVDVKTLDPRPYLL
eukprot:TRINITY_DN12409_c0_g1_i1.p1 TRINITY_DN12409_c0_g1~~TRINITY_DN12409_c0_g1_i1.p1  ORF type:complete len:243 (+),score=61.94 TRINITY_DN12409_c0_g1_i1:66-794(+)